MIVLGGGAVGCELGQMLARFGVAVMIVEAQERLLPAEEPEASELLGTVFRGEGIAVHAEARFERIAAWGSSLVAVLEAGTQLSADRLLVVTGRAASLDGLGLETAGVDGSSGYVQVDGRLRAGEGVWAIGDAPGEACSRTRPCTGLHRRRGHPGGGLARGRLPLAATRDLHRSRDRLGRAG